MQDTSRPWYHQPDNPAINTLVRKRMCFDTRSLFVKEGDMPTMQKEYRYPVFLSLRGKTCIVVGGGHVALRKVRSLLPSGANIVVISPQLHPELQTLLAIESIHYIPASYSREHLPGATLVFATTNDHTINQQVAQDAQQLGLWTNIADDPDASDFHVPATIHRQDLTLAISTAGNSPAFARYIREQLEQALHESLGQALDMIAQARSRILAAPKEQQAQLWDSLLSLHLETVIETEGYTAAYSRFEHWLAQKGLSSDD
jgi:precorrin-2 dehydrogenase/sirohydrochlorin ferrochelatase